MAVKDFLKVSYENSKDTIITMFSSNSKDKFEQAKISFDNSPSYNQLSLQNKHGLSNFIKNLSTDYENSSASFNNIDLFLRRMLDNYQSVFTGLEVKSVGNLDIASASMVLEKLKRTSEINTNFESKSNHVVLDFTPVFSNYQINSQTPSSSINSQDISSINVTSKTKPYQAESTTNLNFNVSFEGFTYGRTQKIEEEIL